MPNTALPPLQINRAIHRQCYGFYILRSFLDKQKDRSLLIRRKCLFSSQLAAQLPMNLFFLSYTHYFAGISQRRGIAHVQVGNKG